MTPAIARARGSARWKGSLQWPLLPLGVVVWLAGTFVADLKSATPTVGAPQAQAPAQTKPADPKSTPQKPPQAKPVDPKSAQPAPRPNPFATFGEEDEEDKAATPAQQKPAEQKPAEQKPAQATPAAPTPAEPKAATPAAKPNPFSAVAEEEPEPALSAPQKPGANPFVISEPAPKERHFTYTGTAKCVRCHAKQLAAYRVSAHGRPFDERTPAADLGCEKCHGPGQAHDDDPGAKDLVRTFNRIPPREASKVCLGCHDDMEHNSFQGSQHDARNVSCVSCHSMHGAKSERGQLKGETAAATCARCHADKVAKMQRSSHMPVREGKMDCSSCHAAHGSTNVRLLRAGNTVTESCLSCHAEKRGPFLWEHAPVVENCATCHDVHGSSNDRMLVAKGTMLCQRCHNHTRHPSTPYDGLSLANRSNRLISRGCVNCHSMVHGSNHPSGQFLAR